MVFVSIFEISFLSLFTVKVLLNKRTQIAASSGVSAYFIGKRLGANKTT